MSKPLVTYAQNREDLYLFALLGHVKKGFYIDVGAHHPTFHSVTKLFYDRGWNGINIEPNPVLHKDFISKRKRDININVGASNKKGALLFRNYPHHSGLSTFSKEIQDIHEQEGIPHEDYKVRTDTLKSILRRHKIKNIDFLKIDVEGYEVEVLEGFDWQSYRPKVVVIEATVRQKLKKIMKDQYYKLEFFDGLNNYYIDTKTKGDLTIYNYAPRILGAGVYTAEELRCQENVKELEAIIRNYREQEEKRNKKTSNKLKRRTRALVARPKRQLTSLLRKN